MRGLGLSHTTYSSFLESGGFRELNHGFLEFTRTLMSSPSSSLIHQNPPPPKSIASFPPKGPDVSLSPESCAFHLGPLSAESPVFLLEHFVLFPALKCTSARLLSNIWEHCWPVINATDQTPRARISKTGSFNSRHDPLDVSWVSFFRIGNSQWARWHTNSSPNSWEEDNRGLCSLSLAQTGPKPA